MENNIESMELEEMRQQMAALRAQLDDQLQLNENRLQRILEQERRNIYGFGLWYLVSAVLAIIFLLFACCYVKGLLLIGIAMSISCLATGAFHYYTSHNIKKTDLSYASMKETAANLIETKRRITKFTIIDTCIVSPPFLLWLGYILCEQYQKNWHTVILELVGIFVIGTTYEWYIISRQRRNINKMIDTLQEGMES